SVAESFVSYDTKYPQNGFHEQNPEEWWEAVVASTAKLLQKPGVDSKNIVSIAVSGHSLGVIPIGMNGELLTTAVPIWSDFRAVEQAKLFFNGISQEEWYSTTGNGFPAHLYSIFKLMWFKSNAPDIYKNANKFIGTKDYINFLLTGRLCTDFSYASGSGVYDLVKWMYQPEYVKASGISADKFPEILPSTEMIGTLLPQVAIDLGLPQSVQVACGAVDNSCMALGAGCISNGMAYTSLGSSAWIAVSGSEPIIDCQKKPYVFTHCIPGMFVSSVGVFAAGSSFRWLRDNICINLLSEKEPYDAMTRLANQSPIGSRKLIFIPSLAGGSSLDKSPNIKGGFIGFQLGHTQNDLIRSVLEGISLSLRIGLDVMQNYSPFANDMLIVGGGGRSQFWRDLLANVYNKNIVETKIGQDAGSLGAAAIAAVGVGLWKDFGKVQQLHVEKSRIMPDRDSVQKYEIILRLFRELNNRFADMGDLIEQTNW
ncbi:MAG: pentose kinase, partial [Anaerolineae bacterium]|nr:pentose kinase [Anaerolineae bacterium]